MAISLTQRRSERNSAPIVMHLPAHPGSSLPRPQLLEATSVLITPASVVVSPSSLIAPRWAMLLVASLRNGRWGIPKGHLDPGETSSVAALREAFEEAGVAGEVDPEVFGSFSYQKDSTPHRYHVAVHLLEASRIATDFPENTIRKQKWFPIEVAIRDVSQSGLRALLKRLR